MNNINMDLMINTARKFSNNFGAFQILFADGEHYTCKTPIECKVGIYRLQYMKNHPETYKGILTISVPEEEGTTYWMRKAYGSYKEEQKNAEN